MWSATLIEADISIFGLYEVGKQRLTNVLWKFGNNHRRELPAIDFDLSFGKSSTNLRTWYTSYVVMGCKAFDYTRKSAERRLVHNNEITKAPIKLLWRHLTSGISVTNGSGNGLSPVRPRAIARTNYDQFLIGPSGIGFCEWNSQAVEFAVVTAFRFNISLTVDLRLFWRKVLMLLCIAW